jgi:predicted cupin superfamily sugar epimerase
MSEAKHWIDALQLRPHPEGGYYRETYRAKEVVQREHLPARFQGDRSFSTAIYFLLQGADFSALHRIKQDEVWHFYEGLPLTVHVIALDGTYTAHQLGRNLLQREAPQAVVQAGCLFGASLKDSKGFALVGCTVAPGFDFADLEMPSREELLKAYPQHRQVIEKLTR